MENSEAFPANLVVGSKVFVVNDMTMYVDTVTSVTEKFIVTEDGRKWRRVDGSRVTSDKWDRTHMYELTPANTREFNVRVARNRLNGRIDWAAVPDEMVLEFYKRLKDMPGAFNK